MKKIIFALTFAFLPMLALAQSYSYDLPGSQSTVLQDINSDGVILGTAGIHGNNDITISFLKDGDNVVTFRYNNYPSTAAAGLNDNGVIVGTFTTVQYGQTIPFVYENGVFTPVVIAGSANAFLYDVNNDGLAVGTWFEADGTAHAFTYDVNTGVITPSSTVADITGINDAGIQVGTTFGATVHGVIRQNGVDSQFDFPGSTQFTTIVKIINDGSFVGAYRVDDTTPLIGYASDATENLSSYTFQGSIHTALLGLNASKVVGWYMNDHNFHVHGFIADR